MTTPTTRCPTATSHDPAAMAAGKTPRAAAAAATALALFAILVSLPEASAQCQQQWSQCGGKQWWVLTRLP